MDREQIAVHPIPSLVDSPDYDRKCRFGLLISDVHGLNDLSSYFWLCDEA